MIASYGKEMGQDDYQWMSKDNTKSFGGVKS